MKKILAALVAVTTIGAATLATSGTADARWGGGYGWGPGPIIGGLAAGAIIGGAIAARPYPYGYAGYYGYGPYYGGYGPGYGPGCRLRTVWNGYNWVRACY